MPFASHYFCLICMLSLSISHALKFKMPKLGVQAQEIWISSYPRTASSTLLSLVRAALPENNVFSLYEPGDPQDVLPLETRDDGTYNSREVVEKLIQCDFDGVTSLHHWTDVHTTNNGKEYSPSIASQMCFSSSLRIIKTVGDIITLDVDSRRIGQAVDLLDRRPNLKILDLVRDPRAVYASLLTLPEFADFLKYREKPVWQELCDIYSSNMNSTHPRVFTVLYEKLIFNPAPYMQTIYDFIGLDFGLAQMTWLNATFPPTDDDCTDHDCDDHGIRYADCHGQKESLKGMDEWRDVLDAEVKEKIASHSTCQEVMTAYGWPLA